MTVRPEHPMTMTGWCAFPSAGSHEYCQSTGMTCACTCHADAYTPDRCLMCELDEHEQCRAGEYDPATDCWDGCACPNFTHVPIREGVN